MKLTVQHVFDATLVVSRIIREQRPMPLRGKYLLARMHAKLMPEFNTASAQRDAMITAYGVHETRVETVAGEIVTTEGPGFTVPPDKVTEFTAEWAAIGATEIEVDVTPIALADLDAGGNGSIEAAELVTLGDLVAE